MSFNLGNAIKYLWRADEKGNAIEDLQKARWYVQREIERRAEAERPTDSTHYMRAEPGWHNPAQGPHPDCEQCCHCGPNGTPAGTGRAHKVECPLHLVAGFGLRP